MTKPVSQVMSKVPLITAQEGVSPMRLWDCCAKQDPRSCPSSMGRAADRFDHREGFRQDRTASAGHEGQRRTPAGQGSRRRRRRRVGTGDGIGRRRSRCADRRHGARPQSSCSRHGRQGQRPRWAIWSRSSAAMSRRGAQPRPLVEAGADAVKVESDPAPSAPRAWSRVSVHRRSPRFSRRPRCIAPAGCR